MVQDRIERYTRIRGWLDGPLEQRPSPHKILNQMLVEEQKMNLRLTNEGESWNLLPPKQITTVAGQSEYGIVQPVSGAMQSGKVYFVVRSTGDSNIPFVPVPFDDYSELDYGLMPTGMTSSLLVPEKVSVYRSAMENQSRVLVIQPAPQEVLTYTVYFYVGQMDRLQAAMSSSGIVTELTDYIDLVTTIALLPYSGWEGIAPGQAEDGKAAKLAKGLEFQFSSYEPIVDDYIETVNAPQSFDLDPVY